MERGGRRKSSQHEEKSGHSVRGICVQVSVRVGVWAVAHANRKRARRLACTCVLHTPHFSTSKHTKPQTVSEARKGVGTIESRLADTVRWAVNVNKRWCVGEDVDTGE